MKKYLITTITLMLISINSYAREEVREVEIKKVGDNLYMLLNKKEIIKTKYCHKYISYKESAIIKITNTYSSYNIGKIIFEDSRSCDIEKIYLDK